MYNIGNSFNTHIDIPVNTGEINKIEQTDELVIIYYAGGSTEYLSFQQYRERQQENSSLPPLNTGQTCMSRNPFETPTFEQSASYIDPKNYLPPEPEFEEKSEVKYDSEKNEFKVTHDDMIITYSEEGYFNKQASGPEFREFFQQVKKVRADLKGVNEEIADLENKNQQIESLTENQNQLETEIKKNKNTIEQLEIENNNIKHLLEKQNSEAQNTQNKKKDLKKKFHEQKTHSETLSQQNQALSAESEKLKKEILDLKTTNTNLSNQQKQTKTDLNKLGNVFNLLLTTSGEISDKNQYLTQQIKTKDQEKEDIYKELFEANVEVKALKKNQEVIAQLTSEKQRLESQLKNLITELETCRNEMIKLKKELKTQIQHRNMFLKNSFQFFEKAKKLEKQISTIEKTNTELKYNIQTLIDKKAQTESEKTEITEKLSDIELELEKTKQELELSKQELGDAKQELQNLQVTIEKISLKNINLTNSNNKNNEDINNLTSTNEKQNTNLKQILTSTRKTNRLAILIIVSVIAIAIGLAVTCVFTGGLGLVVIPITTHFALTVGNFVFPVLGGVVLIELVAYGKSYSNQQRLLNNALIC